jgi:phosphoribosyl-AMP cyclohydrolase
MAPDNADKKETLPFAARTSVEQVEEGCYLAPKFDTDGLIPCVTTKSATGQVLMLGYMNSEALERTIEPGEAHYWSRSRACLWHKGATSGLVQKVVEMRVDDDQDAVWLRVQVGGSGRQLSRWLSVLLLSLRSAGKHGQGCPTTQIRGGNQTLRANGRLRRCAQSHSIVSFDRGRQEWCLCR